MLLYIAPRWAIRYIGMHAQFTTALPGRILYPEWRATVLLWSVFARRAGDARAMARQFGLSASLQQ